MIEDNRYIVVKDGVGIRGSYNKNYRQLMYSTPLQVPVGTVVVFEGANYLISSMGLRGSAYKVDNWGRAIQPDGRMITGEISPQTNDRKVDLRYFKNCNEATKPEDVFLCHPIREMTKSDIMQEYGGDYNLDRSWKRDKMIEHVLEQKGMVTSPKTYLKKINEKNDAIENALEKLIDDKGYVTNGRKCICFDKNANCKEKGKDPFWSNDTIKFLSKNGVKNLNTVADLFPLMNNKEKFSQLEFKENEMCYKK